MDSVTGSIIITKKLDREVMSEHLLIVIVKDQGTPAKRNYAKVLITVHDHNDHAPEFTTKILQGKVYETAAKGSSIVRVYATDRDTGDNAKITYSIISGNIGNVFNIEPVMGSIMVAKDLDMSTLSEYMLQVKASDNGKPALSSQIPVHIMINMADNAPPRYLFKFSFIFFCIISTYVARNNSVHFLSLVSLSCTISFRFVCTDSAAEIFENLPIGTFVTHLEARSTSSLLFEIIDGNKADKFFINPSTGVITTKDILDYEINKSHNLTIRATNMASSSAICTVIVHVLDCNDNAPHFEQEVYRGEISEAAPIGSLVVTLNENNQR